MIRQQQAFAVQLLNGGEKGFQGRGIIEVGRLVAELTIDLRQRRAAQTVATHAEVNQQQLGFALVQAQLRGQGPAHVADRGKSAHDERQGRGDPLLLAGVLPHRAH